jgi:hypothetical protein
MIKRCFSWVQSFISHPWTVPLFLLAICAAAYAPLITRLGFYWDDFPINWIAATMGGDGLARYFSGNRPVWGMIYRLTTPLLGSAPLTWQVFGLLMRWVTGLVLWWLLRLVWKDREQFAAWAAAAFVLYPGFSQQFIAFMYSHFFIVLTSLLLSLVMMTLSLRHPRWYWPFTLLSVLLGLLNMLAMEYFFLLDLLRPALIWIMLSESIPDWRKRLQKTLLLWLPYLLMFGGAMFWRSVLFGFQTYQPALMSRLKTQPIQALLTLVPTMLRDVWKASAGAWSNAFTLPTIQALGASNLQRYWVFVGGSAFLSALFLLFYRPVQRRDKQLWAIQPLVLGLLALFIAGGPFWLTDLKVGLVFPNDRFTLPFMLGTSLIFAGLLSGIPLPRWFKPILLGVAIGFAVGLHFQSAIVYNRDWSVQRSLFWQMTWRMPALQPGTILLSNELPVVHYTDNSLSAPLNWTFDPHNQPLVMKYMLFYPTLRQAEAMGNFEAHYQIHHDYLAATFNGSTDQVVVIYYQPPGCLRVLDPEIEQANWMVPNYLRDTLFLTSTKPILTSLPAGSAAPQPPAQIYGSEIARGWCYYYEKADLARQAGDWATVTALGNTAFAGSDYPNDPIERFPFIEGYAHTGSWSRALALSQETYTITAVTQPMLCKLWQRIDRETQAGDGKQQALNAIQETLQCVTK